MPVPPGSTKASVPPALKLLRGTANKSREAKKNPPKTVPKVPPPPEHLDEEERAAWAKFAAILDPLRVCSAEDAAALESLVTAWVQAQRLRAELRDDAEGGDKTLTYETTNQAGAAMQRIKAALTALNEVDRRVKDWLGRFGLTPADRGRVRAAGDGKDSSDPEAEFT